MVVNLESLLNSSDEFFANFASFLIAIVVMYTVNPIFSLALFSWCVLFFIISVIFSKSIHQLSKLTSESYSKYSGTLVDIFSNISSVRLFSRFKYETKNLSDSVDNLVRKDRNMLKYIIKMRLVQDVTLVALLGGMLYMLLNLYNKGLVTIGDFALTLTITMSIFQSMWHIANKIVDVYKNIGKCYQAMSLIEVKHEIIDQENAKNLVVHSGAIEFKNVTFSYKNSRPIFSNQNIKINAGSKVGLVGYSGSGKSTFINLILRLYDITAGDILIDNQSIQAVSQDSLRHNISMIPQDISLFHRSLMDNIRYSNVNASKEDIIEASKKAHCHEFISNLHKGYDTLAGEKFAGYVTLKWQSDYKIFADDNIPEISDLNVLPSFRKKGIGSALIEKCETYAVKRSNIVGIGVGLYPDYGAAQRLYIKRGYIPDGHGATYNYEYVTPGKEYPLDDDLVLWFTKKLNKYQGINE